MLEPLYPCFCGAFGGMRMHMRTGRVATPPRPRSRLNSPSHTPQTHAHRRKGRMSGVEAAGFVLAAFPLLISALEHYRESAEVLKDWWRYKREYRKVKVEYHISTIDRRSSESPVEIRCSTSLSVRHVKRQPEVDPWTTSSSILKLLWMPEDIERVGPFQGSTRIPRFIFITLESNITIGRNLLPPPGF